LKQNFSLDELRQKAQVIQANRKLADEQRESPQQTRGKVGPGILSYKSLCAVVRCANLSNPPYSARIRKQEVEIL
jgi:hypothetical protein